MSKVSEEHYEIIDKGSDNFHHILLKDPSPFLSVVFQFGMVQLIEEDDQLRIKFEYEVFDNPLKHNTQTPAFRDYIGVILVQNLEELLIYNNHKRANTRD